MLDTKRDLIIFQKKGGEEEPGIIRMIKKQNYYSSFIENNKNNNNKNYIIVDITVADCQIRSVKPADPFQSDPMPHGDAEKAIWWNNPCERFEISQYSDAYAKELEKLIDSKAKRKTIVAKPEKVKEETKDLVAALKASLQEARTKR